MKPERKHFKDKLGVLLVCAFDLIIDDRNNLERTEHILKQYNKTITEFIEEFSE